MTGHLLYTEEDVELLARAIREACPTDDQCVADEEECFRAHPVHEAVSRDGVIESVYADIDGLVRTILAALSSSGRLLPPGSETDWRVRYPTLGRVSPPIGPMPEALVRETAEKARAGGLEAIVESRITTPWSVPDTEPEG